MSLSKQHTPPGFCEIIYLDKNQEAEFTMKITARSGKEEDAEKYYKMLYKDLIAGYNARFFSNILTERMLDYYAEEHMLIGKHGALSYDIDQYFKWKEAENQPPPLPLWKQLWKLSKTIMEDSAELLLFTDSVTKNNT